MPCQSPTRHPSTPRGSLLILALFFGLTIGCAEKAPEPPPEPPEPPRNVVVIMLDTLRADHLSALGYERQTSPFLDELAAEGLLFENMVSAAPATFPSVNSLFTSRDPTLFFRKSSRDFGIPEELDTLAEVFKANGFRTAAVSSSPVVRASPSFFNPDGGFGQGFDTFDESCGFAKRHVPPFSTPCVMEKTVETLDTLGKDPFFLYVHVLDPHDPYLPPEEYKIFGEPYEGKDFVTEGRTFPVKQLLNGARDDFVLEEADIQHYIDLYDAEILAVDNHLRQLFAQFEARNLLEDTLFVFVSDHGESFLEHEGIWQHGTSVYQSEIYTLFMLYWKGRWNDGERRRELACTIDVMPTVLEIVGLPKPEDLEGVPLLSLDRASQRSKLCHTAGRADWRAQQADLLALRAGSEKLIFDRKAGDYELYDLSQDSDETQNLASPDNERLAPLRTVLETWDQNLGDQEGSVELDPEAEKALRALGYID